MHILSKTYSLVLDKFGNAFERMIFNFTTQNSGLGTRWETVKIGSSNIFDPSGNKLLPEPYGSIRLHWINGR